MRRGKSSDRVEFDQVSRPYITQWGTLSFGLECITQQVDLEFPSYNIGAS